MSPAIRELKLAFPRTEIDMITSPLGKEIFKYNPYIRKIFVYRKNTFINQIKDFVSLLVKIRNEKYDLSLSFYASISECFLVGLSGIPKRVVYRHGLTSKDMFGNIPVIAKKEVKSVIERDFDVIRSIGIEPQSPETEIFISGEEKEFARSFLKSKNNSEFIAIFPGAREPKKRWQLENYIELIKRVKKDFNLNIVVILGLAEKGIREKIYSAVANEVLYLVEENILRVASVIERCKLFIGNDSGIKHIAVAMKCPTITVMNKKNVEEWHPYPFDRHIIIKGFSINEVVVVDVLMCIGEQLKKI